MAENSASPPTVIVSFDVEEHFRIEAAAGIACPVSLRADYGRRMDASTRRLLEQMAAAGVIGTFYVVGEIAQAHPDLIRDIQRAGHEVGSHSWDHRRVNRFTPDSFREDLLKSKDALEQVIGEPVYGFRAPTFSVARSTAWAVDVLAECGFLYDTSIFPVRHDRYGIPDAPRVPFWAVGRERRILELPPATYRLLGQNLPVAGGGYFRIFPPAFMRAGIRQLARAEPGAVGMLYFHPWEFDADQPRLPLRRLSRWRTYAGVRRTTRRLDELLRGPYSFRRAIDVARGILDADQPLPRFAVGG